MNKEDRLRSMGPINKVADQMREGINDLVGMIADRELEAAIDKCDELVALIKEFQKDLHYDKI